VTQDEKNAEESNPIINEHRRLLKEAEEELARDLSAAQQKFAKRKATLEGQLSQQMAQTKIPKVEAPADCQLCFSEIESHGLFPNLSDPTSPNLTQTIASHP